MPHNKAIQHSILIVSSSEHFQGLVKRSLKDFITIDSAGSGSAARRYILEKYYGACGGSWHTGGGEACACRPIGPGSPVSDGSTEQDMQVEAENAKSGGENGGAADCEQSKTASCGKEGNDGG